MSSQKKILVLGAGGAMGRYLVPRLVEKGFLVDAVLMNDPPEDWISLQGMKTFITNAKDVKFLMEILPNHYDGIADFLLYPTSDLAVYLPRNASFTDHYIYISTYRIYDDKEHPVRETSPRLLDSSEDLILRNSDDYSVYKARGENILHALPRKNWTIVRPAITYSFMRYELVTIGAPNTVARAFAGKKVVVPEQARTKQATMSWGGDVARMIANLFFNDKAPGEAFTVATAEHHTWGEIAGYYREICNLQTVWVDKEDYLKLIQADPFNPYSRWHLEKDRLFDRIMDNSKILAATGMKQSELMALFDGLKKEVSRCPKDHKWPDNELNARMDDYLAKHI